MKTDKKPLSLYIHIPFCVRKCLYCDFLSAPGDETTKENYVERLKEEIRQAAGDYDGYQVQTVFIGGGTPSVLPAYRIGEILEAVSVNYSMDDAPEITIEVNPGTVSPKKLEAYRAMGVNRLSIGLQSANEEELKALGRAHGVKEFLEAYEGAVRAGFQNINVDLMSAVPGQTIESWRATLKTVLELDPPPAHISAYSLIIEEGTPFYENTPELPDEETDRLLYKITDDILKEKGYHRYEISNYAREGYECRHNKIYWKRGDYAGFGIGAASLVDNVRFSNIREIDAYMSRRDVRENRETLSPKEQMEEFMFLGLRLTEGVSPAEFKKNFGRAIEEVYPGLLDRLEAQGLLCRSYGASGEIERVFLSRFGLDVSNRVMAEFLLD